MNESVIKVYDHFNNHPSSTKGLCVCHYVVLMILPQVHLRKPCYDFSFL